MTVNVLFLMKSCRTIPYCTASYLGTPGHYFPKLKISSWYSRTYFKEFSRYIALRIAPYLTSLPNQSSYSGIFHYVAIQPSGRTGSFGRHALFCKQIHVPNSILLHYDRIRSLGSAALNMATIASGAADVYYEWGIHCWDMAAGKLLIEEAGGVVASTKGEFIITAVE